MKSNAVLLADGGAAVGIGMGQVNRVDAARLAVSRAGGRADGSVAASDAFFPFADGLQVLLSAGVRAVVQPGGSVRDDEVVAAASDAGVTMYLTGTLPALTREITPVYHPTRPCRLVAGPRRLLSRSRRRSR